MHEQKRLGDLQLHLAICMAQLRSAPIAYKVRLRTGEFEILLAHAWCIPSSLAFQPARSRRSRMRSISFEAMSRLVADHRNSWSIGGFGALGEFCRDAEEPCEQYFGHNRIQLATARGAIRLVRGAFPTIAWGQSFGRRYWLEPLIGALRAAFGTPAQCPSSTRS